MIAGIAGGVVAVILIGAIIFCLMRRNKRRNRTNRESRTMDDDLFAPAGNVSNGGEKGNNYGYQTNNVPVNTANPTWESHPSEQGFTVASSEPTMVDYNQIRSPPVVYATAGQYYANDQSQQYPVDNGYSPQLAHNTPYLSTGVGHDTNMNSLNHQQQPELYYEPHLQQQQMYHDPQEQMYHDPHQQGMYQDPTLSPQQQQAMYNQQMMYQGNANGAYVDPNDMAYTDPKAQGYQQAYQDNGNNNYYYQDSTYMNGQPAQYAQQIHQETPVEYNKPQQHAPPHAVTTNYMTPNQTTPSY